MASSGSLQERIRHCLNAPCEDNITGDFAVAGWPREERTLMPAAVLIPLVQRATGLTVLLTQRTDHLIHHGGQISFPGGRVEHHDANPIETALRETEEEIGLHRRHVDIVGLLDIYQTVTGFSITPVVSFIEPVFELNPDPFEVADVFEVPLSFTMDSRNHQYREKMYQGQSRGFYVISYEGRYIWGATAAMLVHFAHKLDSCHHP